MPTIDELPAAQSVGDSDAFMVSQSGISRKALRSQIIAGLQAGIALPQGSLLGRISAGVGAPQAITIGANLSVVNGAISAPAAFSIAGSADGGPIQADNLVPVSQGGQNANLPYSSFMSGISTLAGVDVSSLDVTAMGAPAGRSLALIAADAVAVEAFGAVGDGATDDTSAFELALASGRALRLDAKVYIVNGALAINVNTALLGVAQGTVIRRISLTGGGDWISVGAANFFASGVVFDAGGLQASDNAAVFVGASCSSAQFFQCGFRNACGASAGCGLTVQGGSNAGHVVDHCFADNNALHGISTSGAGSVTITACSCRGNGAYGVSVANGVGATVSSNNCSGNQCGISIGAWNQVPFALNTARPVNIAENFCSVNSNWGLAVACSSGVIADNILSSNGSVSLGGGILARLATSRLSGNVVSGGATGMDCRCGSDCLITENMIYNTGTGVLVGGGQNMLVSQNFLAGNVWGLVVSAIEPAITALPTSAVTIGSNWIGFTLAQGGGVSILDGALTIAVIDNGFYGAGSATIDQALWVHTDSAIMRGNTWNNATRFPVSVATIANLPTLVVPDVADDAFVVTAPPGVQSILTSHQANTLGQIGFVRVLAGGADYTQASVTITGSGTGAVAQAVIENGALTWIVLKNAGSGYGQIGAAATVTIDGDGTGATAQAYVGLPVIEGKRLRLACNTDLRLVQAGSVPRMTSWTGFDTTVPAMGAVEIEGTYGQWRAVQNPPVDYLTPTGDGGAVLQTLSGADLTLRPSGGGTLQIGSASEPNGYVTAVGRGSPEGAVSAPPGSDFRNLDGGVGNTLWIKLVGTDNQGWTAIA